MAEDDDAFSVSDTEAGKSDDDVDHDHVVTAACDSDDGGDHGGTAGPVARAQSEAAHEPHSWRAQRDCFFAYHTEPAQE